MKNYLNNNFDFLKLIDVFDELPLWSAPFGLKLLDYIEYKPGISVLDIGFGTGFPLTEIALRLGEDAKVYGIDPWKETFARVNKKIEYYGIKNITLIEGVAESIPLEDGSIDLVTSNNGLNNVENIEKSFQECSRVLKKGGQFLQTMNTEKSMFEFYEQLEQVLRELRLFSEIDSMYAHIHQKRPSIDSMIKLTNKHGFIIKDLEQCQFNYRFASGTAMLNHYFIRLAFMDSWVKLLPKEKINQIFDLIEKRLNEQAAILGGMKLSIPYILINAKKA